MLRSCVVYFACSLLLCSFAWAQTPTAPEMKWGEIPQSDLAMKSCPFDTAAPAVVLFDEGESSVNDNLGLLFHRHVRIKILKKAGIPWGTFVLRYCNKGGRESVADLRGATYNVGPTGEVLTTTMTDANVVIEGADSRFGTTTCTLPSVQPGSVVELEYRIKIKGIGQPQGWTFQRSIPALWSEYRMISPNVLVFGMTRRGMIPFAVDTLTDLTRRFSGEMKDLLMTDQAPCYQLRWAMQNVPGLPEELYSSCQSDQLEHIDLQLARMSIPGKDLGKYAQTWESFVKDLVKDREVGDAIDVTGKVREAAEPIIAGLTAKESKARALFEFVRDHYNYNGTRTWWAERKVNDILEARRGTSGEMVILMLSMMRAAGFEAFPIILSTRDHGRLQERYPIDEQFNAMVGCVVVEGKRFILDPTDRSRAFDMLPAEVLERQGLAIKDGPVEWVSLSSLKLRVRQRDVDADIARNGKVNVRIVERNLDYAALERRHMYRKGVEYDYLREMLQPDPSRWSVDSVGVEGQDNTDVPFHVTGRASLDGYAKMSGDSLYVNPFVVGRFSSNPFPPQVRRLPVDMTYQQRLETTIVLHLPDGYQPVELPSDRSGKIGSDATFMVSYASQGRNVTVRTSINILATEFPPGAYSRLRDFYQKLVSITSNVIVGVKGRKGVSHDR